MIATVVLWTYFAFVLFAYGAAVAMFIRRYLGLQMIIPVPLPILALLGLHAVVWLSAVLSLVLKMGMPAHLFILAGALMVFYFRHQEIKDSLLAEFARNHWVVWVIFLLGCVTTILYAVKIPANPDTPLYHAQAIHWIEEYPAVPGLANLDPRLGSNSNWLVVNAFFSLSFLRLQSFHLIPSFLFLVCFLYFLGGLQNILDGDFRPSQIVRVGFIPFTFYVLVDEVSSPGTDLPVILLYWVILCLWLESIEQTNSPHFLRTVVFLLAVSVITFKVSGILILLFALWVWVDLLRQRQYRLLWLHTGIAGAILVPWLARTFILTGYWFYPEPLMASIGPDVDWSVPVERVLSFKRGIQAWALSPRLVWEDVAGLSLFQRLNFWFANLTFNQKGIVFLALCSPILLMIFYFASRRNEKRNTSYFPAILLSYLNLLFWLFMAPNFRFGYGFVVGAIVLACSLPLKSAYEKLGMYRYPIALALALVLSVQQVHVILGSVRDGTRHADYLLLPAAYPQAATDPCKVGEVTISCAKNWRQCGYDAFPCIPQTPKNVEVRGETFRDGFRRIPFQE